MTSHPSPASLSILVADDEPLLRRMITNSLAGLGHTVRVAGDGAEALRVFQEEECHLVLTDYAMPHMNGDTLATAIKQLSPQTPVILMTGYRSPAACAAVDCHLRKPFTSSDLVRAISDIQAKCAGK